MVHLAARAMPTAGLILRHDAAKQLSEEEASMTSNSAQCHIRASRSTGARIEPHGYPLEA